jgi:O-acetylserine/cysteine efflux transporter
MAHISTLFWFSVRGVLTARYSVATVAPLTLPAPVFGFSGAAVLLGEPLQSWKFGAAALIIAGQLVNMYGAQWPPVRNLTLPLQQPVRLHYLWAHIGGGTHEPV